MLRVKKNCTYERTQNTYMSRGSKWNKLAMAFPENFSIHRLNQYFLSNIVLWASRTWWYSIAQAKPSFCFLGFFQPDDIHL